MKKDILIIEDHQDILDMYITEMELQGYSAEGANGGNEVIEKVSRKHYDLILLDIMLPDMDGITLLRTLRSHHIGDEVLVYMLTVLEDDKIITRSIEAGANGYFKKSAYSPIELVKEIRKILPTE